MEWNAEHYTKKERKKERTKEERRKVEQSTTINFRGETGIGMESQN